MSLEINSPTYYPKAFLNRLRHLSTELVLFVSLIFVTEPKCDENGLLPFFFVFS